MRYVLHAMSVVVCVATDRVISGHSGSYVQLFVVLRHRLNLSPAFYSWAGRLRSYRDARLVNFFLDLVHLGNSSAYFSLSKCHTKRFRLRSAFRVVLKAIFNVEIPPKPHFWPSDAEFTVKKLYALNNF